MDSGNAPVIPQAYQNGIISEESWLSADLQLQVRVYDIHSKVPVPVDLNS